MRSMGPEKGERPPKRRWHPALTAALVSLTIGIVLGVGIARTGYASVPPVLAMGLAIGTGIAVGAFEAKRLYGLWAGTLLGALIGILSSYDLLVQPIEDMATVVTATVGFFLALGAVIGAFIEVVRYLHRVAHDAAMPARK